MIPMGVGQKNGGFGHLAPDQVLAKIANAGPGIKDQHLARDPHFQTARIPAIHHMVGRRTGNASANSPEFNLNRHSKDPVHPLTVRYGSML